MTDRANPRRPLRAWMEQLTESREKVLRETSLDDLPPATTPYPLFRPTPLHNDFPDVGKKSLTEASDRLVKSIRRNLDAEYERTNGFPAALLFQTHNIHTETEARDGSYFLRMIATPKKNVSVHVDPQKVVKVKSDHGDFFIVASDAITVYKFVNQPEA